MNKPTFILTEKYNALAPKSSLIKHINKGAMFCINLEIKQCIVNI